MLFRSDELEESVAPGKTTLDLEEQAVSLCRKNGVEPAFKGYHGFPFALCCSVNEEVVHGFPSDRKLAEGDIVSVDFGVKYKGFFGDFARTFAVGEVDEQVSQLLAVTEESLYRGIGQAIAGNERPGPGRYDSQKPHAGLGPRGLRRPARPEAL